MSDLWEHHDAGRAVMNGFAIAALIYVVPSLALVIISIVYREDVGSLHMRRRRYDPKHPSTTASPLASDSLKVPETPALDVVESDLFKIVIVERFKSLISR
jgi:hypothetical protein